MKSVDGGCVVGLVDVLNLTYFTINRLIQHQQNPTNSIREDSGPMWSKFWESTDQELLHEEENGTDDDRKTSSTVAKDRQSENDVSVDILSSVNGSQSATTLVPALVDGSGFVFKFKDPFTGAAQRFTSRAVAGEKGESPMAELLESIVKKCGCVVKLAPVGGATPSPFSMCQLRRSPLKRT